MEHRSYEQSTQRSTRTHSDRLRPSAGASAAAGSRSRVLCLGQLMMVLDATIVNVALPSIQRDLHFTQSNLTWVINGYLITFGGFLLLAGQARRPGRPQEGVPHRAGPVHGRLGAVRRRPQPGDADRRSPDPGRRRRGRLERDPRDHRHRVSAGAEQAKAMGVYAFVSAGGGSIGLLAGGALTQSLDWHWIFFVNVPIGVVAFVLGSALIEENEGIGLAGGVDVLGSVLITLATMLGAFAIVKSTRIRAALGAHAAASAAPRWRCWARFLVLESRIANPIMPLRILRLRMLMGSSLVRGLLVTGMFSAFFLGALYLERVLGYDAIDTGLAFMPLTVAIAVMSLGVSARAVERFGRCARWRRAGGIVAGLLLLAEQGVHASYFPGLFFAFLLLGSRRGRVVPAAADDRHVRRAAGATPGWRRGSSTSRCSCSARSAWRRWGRSRPTTPKR